MIRKKMRAAILVEQNAPLVIDDVEIPEFDVGQCKGVRIQSCTPICRWTEKIDNAGCFTIFNEYAVVSGNRLTPMAKDIQFEIAAKMGCVITTARSNVHDEIRMIVGHKGVDVAVESTGVIKLIEQAYELTAHTGRTILIGVPRFDQDITIHSLPLHFGKVLTGYKGVQSSNPTVDIPRYLNLYRKGKLKLDRLISHRYSLSEINIKLDKIRGW